MNLAKSLFGTFRYSTHISKVEWNVNENNATELFKLASYICIGLSL